MQDPLGGYGGGPGQASMLFNLHIYYSSILISFTIMDKQVPYSISYAGMLDVLCHEVVYLKTQENQIMLKLCYFSLYFFSSRLRGHSETAKV